LGFILGLIPGPLLTFLRLPPAEDYWISVAGMLLVGLSMYYAFAGLYELTAFIKLTAIARSLVLPYFLILVLLNKAPVSILILGTVDLLFAFWTFIALRQDQVQTGRV
jgi:hypothetical protein